MFNVNVSDMQSDVVVSDNAITGSLKWLGTGNEISDDWGAGNFLCLKFADTNSVADSIKVGLVPSASNMDLVELDEDMNGVFQITDKANQKFVVEVTVGSDKYRKEYDLSGLTLASA